ncbi:MAG: DUF4407 domain-containing protein [Verrucomicrobium sp.]|nr:DUF4407 domain-containing protein [Verrucomicrobium sp.]
MSKPGFFARIFVWLSGASDVNLAECPAWEVRKYVAFGATVLVPCVFAFIAAAYAISTLTENWNVVFGVASVWAFIILTVDRALLATYRAYQSFFRKISQFLLRVVVAGLMGITISHPLTLLLFKDTISSVIEKDREIELQGVRTAALDQKKFVEEKMALLDIEIAKARQKWDESFSAKFLVNENGPGDNKNLTEEQKRAKAELEKQITEAKAPTLEKLDAAEKEITSLTTQSVKLQSELDFWQKEFERELNGQRSGIIGLGPRAKSIQSDQLAWRRDESKRLAGTLEARTLERTQLQAEAVSIEQNLTAAAEVKAVAAAAKVRQEQQRIEGLRQQVQQQQADQFVDQQNQIRSTLKAQIDTRLDQMTQFQKELAKIGEDEQSRMAIIRAEPRRDILKQTLALHRVFNEGSEGGQFALTAYVVLSLLFMLVDTIPLMVKFFAKPGPYDTLVDCDEVRFDKERESFLKSYKRYMDELAGGRLLHLTRNKPLEQALIEGVDRSKAAKEFLETLMDLETTFQERVKSQEAALASASSQFSTDERRVMLQHMADTFYSDLRSRMEQFFQQGASKPASTV